MSDPEGTSSQPADETPAAGADPEAAAVGPVDEAAEVEAPETAGPDAAAPRHRHPFYLRGRHVRLPRSRVGVLALILVLVGGGSVAVFTGVSAVTWTETADFCGRCHTMAPELEAYHAGSHRDVACGECHVEPGITGWVKAKLAGTRQLVSIVTGTYPTPIEPPDHAALPTSADTCQKCHSLEDRSFAAVRTQRQFAEDEANTRESVGLMIRPGGGDPFAVDRSVHWHVLSDFDYLSPDTNSAVIDYVTSTREDGSVVEYLAEDKITISDDVQPDIDRLKAADRDVKLSCYDCHNRVGHDVANPRTQMDYKLSTGVIDPSLPYIKREGMRILWESFPDEAAADAAADGLDDFYRLNYPDVHATKGAQIATAIDEIKLLYRHSATPEMNVTAATYPNHLGHLDSPGCFRCHDGGHYKVEAGKVTNEVIPSTCNTCHTFPQIGPAVATVPLGEPPSTHTNDSLWVFNHKDVATSRDPGGQSCGECHARDYCVNCHSTGAVNVDHDAMATNHAQVVRDAGIQSCAYCHQPVSCARCHAEPVLPVTTPNLHVTPAEESPAPDQPSGLAWPLAGLAGPLAPGG